LKFTTSIYQYEIEQGNTNIQKAMYLIPILIAFALLGFAIGFLPDNSAALLVVIGVFSYPVLRFIAFFSKVPHIKKHEGYIGINPESILWNQDSILWDNINKINIEYTDFNDRITVSKGDWINNRMSPGLGNKIEITLTNSKEYKSNLYLESRESIQLLNKVLWEVVKQNNIPYENAKRMVYPKTYKEHQELKGYCG